MKVQLIKTAVYIASFCSQQREKERKKERKRERKKERERERMRDIPTCKTHTHALSLSHTHTYFHTPPPQQAFLFQLGQKQGKNEFKKGDDDQNQLRQRFSKRKTIVVAALYHALHENKVRPIGCGRVDVVTHG